MTPEEEDLGNDQKVFYLINRVRGFESPNLEHFRTSFKEMCRQCALASITRIAIPFGGMGVSDYGLSWPEVYDVIHQELTRFNQTNTQTLRVTIHLDDPEVETTMGTSAMIRIPIKSVYEYQNTQTDHGNISMDLDVPCDYSRDEF